MTETKCRLHEIRLFAELDDAQIEKIDQLCDWMQLPKGKEIVSQEDQSNAVFFIASGKVAAKSYSSEGKEVTFTEIPAGEICGEFAAIDELPRSASVHTIEPSCIAHMSAAQFRELVRTVPLLGYKLAEMLVKKNRSLSERIYEFSTMTVRHRVCAELVRMAEATGSDANTVKINPAPSHYQLSTRISTHREAVSREYSSLAAQGVIEVGRQKLTILDVETLRELTQVELP